MPEQKPHLGCGKKSVFVDILGGICTEIDFLFEQRRNNKLIRPMSKYIGPVGKSYIPMSKRIAKF